MNNAIVFLTSTMNLMDIEVDGAPFKVHVVYKSDQINYEVFNDEGYLFTLIPYDSPEICFDISTLDKYLNIPVDWNLFHEISSKIVNKTQ